MHGVLSTRVGYAGGTTPRPRYHAMGDHSESIEIVYDPAVLSYEDLIVEFWSAHRPTGPRPPAQYGSIIFYSTEQERLAAESSLRVVLVHHDSVHTRVEPLGAFYPAERYHQHYYAKRGLAGLCAITKVRAS